MWRALVEGTPFAHLRDRFIFLQVVRHIIDLDAIEPLGVARGSGTTRSHRFLLTRASGLGSVKGLPVTNSYSVRSMAHARLAWGADSSHADDLSSCAISISE